MVFKKLCSKNPVLSEKNGVLFNASLQKRHFSNLLPLPKKFQFKSFLTKQLKPLIFSDNN